MIWKCNIYILIVKFWTFLEYKMVKVGDILQFEHYIDLLSILIIMFCACLPSLKRIDWLIFVRNIKPLKSNLNEYSLLCHFSMSYSIQTCFPKKSQTLCAAGSSLNILYILETTNIADIQNIFANGNPAVCPHHPSI